MAKTREPKLGRGAGPRDANRARTNSPDLVASPAPEQQDQASLEARNFQQLQGLQALENALAKSESENKTLKVALDRLEKEARTRSSGQSVLAERRMTALASKISAQNWDLNGLRAQRDNAFEQIRSLEKAVKELTLKGTRGRRNLSKDEDEKARLRRMVQLQDHMQMELMRRAADGGAWDRDSALILASGLFDEVYYRRNYSEELQSSERAPLRHYMEEGEARGFRPNPLFDPSDYVRRYGDEIPEGMGLLVHYLGVGQDIDHIPHPLFSPDFYRHQLAARGLTTAQPLPHYLFIGRHIGLAPHALFDPDYYEQQTGPFDWNMSPVEHYLSDGVHRGLDPHPLFDTTFYCERNPDVVSVGINPLAHYINYGDAENRAPSLFFDPGFYRAEYSDISEGQTNTLAHYVVHGGREGRNPHPLFDGRYYASRNSDVDTEEKDPLRHFVEYGAREGRSPHPLFDTSYILETGALPLEARRNALAYYLTVKPGSVISPHPLFDAAHYLAENPELSDFPGGLLLHYLTYGWREGRNPHPLFDISWYRGQTSADGQVQETEPLRHYLEIGAKRGYSPHPLFDPAFYLQRNPDVASTGSDPLVHYVRYGHNEGRVYHPLANEDHIWLQLDRSIDERKAEDLSLLRIISGVPKKWVSPTLLFDVQFYVENLSEDIPDNIHPLLHYLKSDPLGASNPHPLFDNEYYISQIKERRSIKEPLIIHYMQTGAREGITPHPLFDHQYYVDGYSIDLKAPLLHYLEAYQSFHHSNFEPHVVAAATREPNALFETVSYLLANPEIRETRENPLSHSVRTSGVPIPPTQSNQSAAMAAKASSAVETNADSLKVRQFDYAELVRGLASEGLLSNRALSSKSAGFGALDRFLQTQKIYVGGLLDNPALARGVAIYAIYSSDGTLASYQIAMLKELKRAGYRTIIVNSTLSGRDLLIKEAENLADMVVARTAGARDFGSWFAAIALTYFDLIRFDHCLFLNDSLVGPVSSLSPIWDAYDESRTDFWALTESRQRIPHFQSSFFILNSRALRSGAFLHFLLRFEAPENRLDVVTHGELGFNDAMFRSGLSRSTMIPYRSMVDSGVAEFARSVALFTDFANDPKRFSGDHIPEEIAVPYARFAQSWLLAKSHDIRIGRTINPQHMFFDSLICKFGYPFLKKELLIQNPLNNPCLPLLWKKLPQQYVEAASEYLESLDIKPNPPFPTYLRITNALIEAGPLRSDKNGYEG
ncbi:rhamnan synthesis F family protein [Fulvimarina sp. MAC3]|uniref:rhamnan synthesis F family protein n=1 Tax=Fulvimarina sp. MAC3 TaxID=3148887 RepID=UPI0031FC5125